ncbi:hypothetical protein F0U60_27440 [Archangium minus]|uniref:Uncharacterized protein n=1 Tax=Archangium minus TaxID=83450 RepID=A0ABY9WWB6_9BACT|nr:hypothetical protein F0U60_27440 [Archangium minus]
MAQPVACTPAGASGELIAPTTVTRVMEAVQGLITLKDFLDEAEVERVEQVLVECAKEADFKINEQEYGRGNYPSDAECDRVVGRNAKGDSVTRAMQLGTMKHAAAFACIERQLGSQFSEHLTREPRYGRNPSTGEYALSDSWGESLVPDVVLHLVRDANKIRFLYDFLFPCTSNSKSDPLGYRRKTLNRKLDKYKDLPGEKRRALVTPQLGISR